MKPIGIFYATREGHTRRIAEHVGEQIRVRGVECHLKNLAKEPAGADLNDYSGLILAASVHAGQHEPEAVSFVKEYLPELGRLPTAFLSVTLSEAGVERADATAEERVRFGADVKKVLDAFFEETGWHPARVNPVAGALLYTKYNFFIRFIMKRIARKAGAATDTSKDYEYTDWLALDRFVDEFLEEVVPQSRRSLRRSAGPGEFSPCHEAGGYEREQSR